MSESDKKYKCEDCDNEINISFVRLQMMLDASYDLKIKNNKLIKFVKYIASGEPKGIKFKEYGFEYSANILLKEIGEE